MSEYLDALLLGAVLGGVIALLAYHLYQILIKRRGENGDNDISMRL
jgi:hypothetical protein